MWLENGLNLKKIFTSFCLLISLALFFDIYLSRSLALVILLITTTYLIWLFYKVLQSGFYVLITTQKINGINYEIRRRIFPLNLKQSYKEIVESQKPFTIQSRSSLFNVFPKEWFHLDIVRLLISGLPINNILVLGGGACSLGTCLSRYKKIKKIEMIELSQEMINLAKQFFLKDENKINLIHDDGFHYVERCSAHYDLVIIDMFFGAKFHEGILEEAFIKKIKLIIKENGFFIINLGPTFKLNEAIEAWNNLFSLNIYLHNHKNLLISNIEINNLNSDYNNRLLFKAPLKKNCK